MRKILDLIAILSFLMSSSIIGGGVLVYLNRAAIAESITSKVMESIKLPSVPKVGGGSLPSMPRVNL